MTKVELESVDAVRRRLDVEIAADEVASEIENAYDQLRRSANVRGFRRGRVPRQVLERMFGDQVRADVHEKLIRRSFHEAVRQRNIEPIGEPEIVSGGSEPGRPLCYSATVEVKPAIVIADYSGIEVDRPLRKVSEEDIERSLESLRQSFTELIPVTDRETAAAGDVATIDYEARIGGRVVGHGHDRRVEVAGDRGEGEFGSHLLGLACGHPAEFEIDYPGDHADAELAGRRVSFRVTVKAISTAQVPALDDEFARSRTGCDTVDQLRERLRTQLESSSAREADASVRANLVERLVRAHEFEVPRAMIERRTETLVEEVMESLGPRRPPLSREAEVRARLRGDLEPRARDQVRAGLILEAIASQERLEVGAEEIDRQIDLLAEQAGSARERVRALYGESQARGILQSRLLQQRALDLVLERARVRTIEATSGVAGGSGNR